MCLPLVGSGGLLILCRFLGIVGQVHWHRKCSILEKTSGSYVVDGIVIIVLGFHRGQALPDFGETGMFIVIWMIGLD